MLFWILFSYQFVSFFISLRSKCDVTLYLNMCCAFAKWKVAFRSTTIFMLKVFAIEWSQLFIFLSCEWFNCLSTSNPLVLNHFRAHFFYDFTHPNKSINFFNCAKLISDNVKTVFFHSLTHFFFKYIPLFIMYWQVLLRIVT